MNAAPQIVGERAGGTHLYKAVFDLLEQKIVSGELCDGASLKEGSISSILGVSRAPVRHALRLLEKDRLIRPAPGQGFIAGTSSNVVRLNARQLMEVLSSPKDSDVGRSVAWERIYQDVRKHVTACLPFGTYRINEAEIGKRYAVSRTVAREVLGRLMDRQLVEKDRRSHWIAGPLTARDIRDSFEMLRLLEPKALDCVAGDLDSDVLVGMRKKLDLMLARFEQATAEQIEAVEQDLHRNLFEGLKNRRLARALSQNRLPFIVPALFRAHFGTKSDRTGMEEHKFILDQLIKGSTDLACAALEAHLIHAETVTVAKLRVLSVLPKPITPSFLINIH